MPPRWSRMPWCVRSPAGSSRTTSTDGAVHGVVELSVRFRRPSDTATLPRHTLAYSISPREGVVLTRQPEEWQPHRRSPDTFDGGAPTTVALLLPQRRSSHVVHGYRCTDPCKPVRAEPDVRGSRLLVGVRHFTATPTRLGDQTLSYDVADRHIQDRAGSGTTITYVWGPSGDIVFPHLVDRRSDRRFSSGLDPRRQQPRACRTTLSLPGGAMMNVVAAIGPVAAAYDVVVSEPPWRPRSSLPMTAAPRSDCAGARYDPFGLPDRPHHRPDGRTSADDCGGDTIAGLRCRLGAGSAAPASCTSTKGRSRPSRWEPTISSPLSAGPRDRSDRGAVSRMPYDYPADPINRFDLTGESDGGLGGRLAITAGGLSSAQRWESAVCAASVVCGSWWPRRSALAAGVATYVSHDRAG